MFLVGQEVGHEYPTTQPVDASILATGVAALPQYGSERSIVGHGPTLVAPPTAHAIFVQVTAPVVASQ